MGAIALLVIIYILSCVFSYMEVRRSHLEEFKRLDTDLGDLLIVFAPVVNTISSLYYLVFRTFKNNSLTFNKFFNLKRD